MCPYDSCDVVKMFLGVNSLFTVQNRLWNQMTAGLVLVQHPRIRGLLGVPCGVIVSSADSSGVPLRVAVT